CYRDWSSDVCSSDLELLAKETLLDAIWRDTHVTESSLSRAVAVLRDALGEDAHSPQFIETAPRRGYRFIGAVTAEESHVRYHVLFGPQDFILAPGENIIGRSPDVAVYIKSPQVSRHHARIITSSAGATIEDLGSTNGTVVRGQPANHPTALHNDD